MVAVAFAVVMLAGCHNNNGAAITLKFAAGKGTKFNYTTVTDMTMQQAIMGSDVKVTTKITMGYVFSVTNDSAGWKTIDATINKVAMDFNANGEAMQYDSDNPGIDSISPMGKMGAVLGALKGGQFSFTINENGEVGQVTGMKEMLQQKLPAAPGGQSDGMAGVFTEDIFKNNLAQSFSVYPGKPVKEGDTWNKSTLVDITGSKARLDNTYTLETVEGGTAKIKMVSKISADGATPAQGVTISMSGDAKGTSAMDIATGITLNSENIMTVDAKANAQGQQSAMKAELKMTTTGKKL